MIMFLHWTLAAMQKVTHLRLVLMSATGDHSLVEERIPHCQQLVMRGVMHHVKRCFLEQPLDQSHNLLNQMAQIVITFHNERVERPLVDETCQSSGVNESNKFMVFLPGLAQIYQFCEILQRAIDLGWTEMLIPLPFHGQSPPEDVEASVYETLPSWQQLTSIHLRGIQVYSMQNPLRHIQLQWSSNECGMHTVTPGSRDHA